MKPKHAHLVAVPVMRLAGIWVAPPPLLPPDGGTDGADQPSYQSHSQLLVLSDLCYMSPLLFSARILENQSVSQRVVDPPQED